MEYFYRAVKTKDQNGRDCFGIELTRRASDVFESEAQAEEFADICNKNGLSDIHFNEVIDDYLNR